MNREQQERFMRIVHEEQRKIRELEKELDDNMEVGYLIGFRDTTLAKAAELVSTFAIKHLLSSLEKGETE